MRKLKLLLVEDNEHDVFMINEGIEDLDIPCDLLVKNNGEEAINYLNELITKEELHEKEPDIILMDINMPIMDGIEALRRIKNNDKLKHIPVVMLTTSSRKEDVVNAYKEHSSSYIVKPDDIFELEKVLSVIKDYWTRTVRLPNQ